MASSFKEAAKKHALICYCCPSFDSIPARVGANTGIGICPILIDLSVFPSRYKHSALVDNGNKHIITN